MLTLSKQCGKRQQQKALERAQQAENHGAPKRDSQKIPDEERNRQIPSFPRKQQLAAALLAALDHVDQAEHPIQEVCQDGQLRQPNEEKQEL